MKIKNSPYNLTETLGYFKRNFFGPVTKNRGLVTYAPQICVLDSEIQPECQTAFIGDIMDMAGRRLHIGNRLKQFIAPCDYLVGNFEATITAANAAYMAQRHTPQILDALADLFPPEKTFLGLANNHSGDFGFDIWHESATKIKDRGFHLFGSTDVPYVDINKNIRIIGGTQWSNQPVEYVTKIEDASQYHRPGRFNILYPHWGYELELFPRSKIIKAGQSWSTQFNAILGHHSHIPQPITTVPVDKPSGKTKQVIAYGLGDFCIHEELSHYHYGQALKLTIGPNVSGEWQVGKLEWCFVKCKEIDDTVWETDIATHFPYAMS